jgi:hypothetical protein
LTDAVVWSTSDDRIASVYRGRVAAVGAGTAFITANTSATAPGRQSSTVIVLVSQRVDVPEVAYAIDGEARDFATRDGAANVQITLVERAETGAFKTLQKTVTNPDGSFRFLPVLAGRYHLRATSSKFESTEKEVRVPDPAPLTLVLLRKPDTKDPLPSGMSVGSTWIGTIEASPTELQITSVSGATITYNGVKETLELQFRLDGEIVLRGVAYEFLPGTIGRPFNLDTFRGRLSADLQSFAGTWKDAGTGSGQWSVSRRKQ